MLVSGILLVLGLLQHLHTPLAKTCGARFLRDSSAIVPACSSLPRDCSTHRSSHDQCFLLFSYFQAQTSLSAHFRPAGQGSQLQGMKVREAPFTLPAASQTTGTMLSSAHELTLNAALGRSCCRLAADLAGSDLEGRTHACAKVLASEEQEPI